MNTKYVYQKVECEYEYEKPEPKNKECDEE